MSRWTFPYKVGVVMALAAFVIGITAANSMAWPGGEPEKPSTTPQHGKDKDNDKDKDKGHKDDDDDDKGKGGHEKPNPQPAQPTGQPPAAVPPAVTPPAPVVSQGAPPTPLPLKEQVDTESVPPERGVPDNPVVAQTPPQGQPTAPAAERKELAETGLDPALIALLGALCLGGGSLLFRRALARH